MMSTWKKEVVASVIPRSLDPPSGDDVAKEEQCNAEGGSSLANTPA